MPENPLFPLSSQLLGTPEFKPLPPVFSDDEIRAAVEKLRAETSREKVILALSNLLMQVALKGL
jgi:hypothetical protein